MKKVTVIMPAYNHEKFISESIESILAQTYKNIEILILNDGSTDGTKGVIVQYSKLNPNSIRFIDKPNNNGTVAALNDLIDEAKGEYIIWLSSDDLMYPYTVDKLMDCACKNPNHNFIFGGVTNVDENGVELSSVVIESNNEPYFFHKMMLRMNIIPGCSVAVKMECYKKIGGFDARFKCAHDYHMWLRILAYNDVVYIPEPIYKNRVHSGQVTALGMNEVDATRVIFDIFKNKDVLKNYLNRIGMEYNDTSLVYLIKQFASVLIRCKSAHEKKEFVYQLNKYINCCELSDEHKNTLLKEKEFFEIILDKSIIGKLKLTKEAIDKSFYRLAEANGLDGILINKEAVRYHLIDENDIESFFKKVIPHDNVLCIAGISSDNLESLKADLLYFPYSTNNKNFYKIGITGYMALETHYKDKFTHIEMMMLYTLSSSLYKIVIERELNHE